MGICRAVRATKERGTPAGELRKEVNLMVIVKLIAVLVSVIYMSMRVRDWCADFFRDKQ